MNDLSYRTVCEGKYSLVQATVKVALDGPDIIRLARGVRRHAEHYRRQDPVKVGAVAAVWAAGRLAYFEAANKNLAPGNNPTKQCAEHLNFKNIGEDTRFAGGVLIATFNTGPVQADTQSGRLFHTLHPCGIERGIMDDLPFVKPDSLIIPVRTKRTSMEVMRYEQLRPRHEPDFLEANPNIYRSTFKTWEEGSDLLWQHYFGIVDDLKEVQYATPGEMLQAAVTGRYAGDLATRGLIAA